MGNATAYRVDAMIKNLKGRDMTTKKQAAANKANSKKSTGAATPAGKAAVAKNALKHGLLSQRIIIAGEDAQDFEALLAGLLQSIAPDGMLEQLMVEKVAVALWRQKRLVTAESAAIEFNRRADRMTNRNEIDKALGYVYGGDEVNCQVRPGELTGITEEDLEYDALNKAIIAEYQALDDDVIENEDLARLVKESPLLFAELKTEAEDEEIDFTEYTQGNLRELAEQRTNWAYSQVKEYSRRFKINDAIKLMQMSAAAPVSNELLARYSVGLDNELYRAIEALRKQQEFRLKNCGAIEAEAA